jgi:beta-glucosidase
MDNECVTFTSRFGEPVEKAYIDAVQLGYLPESGLDTALIRLFTARIRLGMFDPPDMVPYTKIDEKELDSPEHRAHARKLADESMVLLKNDGILPLKPGIRKIAVVVPLADQTRPLLGNYAGQPTHIVSILDGLHAEFPNATINFIPGTQFLRTDGSPVPDALLTTPDGKPGLKADYTEAIRRGEPSQGAPPAPLVTRTETNVKLTENDLPKEVSGKKTFGVQWSGFLTPSESGDFLIGMRSTGFGRLTVDGKQVAAAIGGSTRGLVSGAGRVHLEKGRKVALEISYGTRNAKPHSELFWSKYSSAPSPEAVAAAKNADVVIAVVGITSQLEGEEMPVSEPGFLGGDRTSIDLPQAEGDLVETVVATGKPVAVVLMNGSALAVNWINEHANAVLDAWYPGEEGGAAVAETLSGKNNPAGRLPLTFYKGVDQLPHFEDYGMANRTYRYFTGKPLYPFGYGLSYTKFSYSDMDASLIGAVVENATGKRLATYMEEKLWKPAGMEHDAFWALDGPPEIGREVPALSFTATLRDYGRFGLLALHQGKANGRQLVSPAWFKAATVPHSPAVQFGKLGDNYPLGSVNITVALGHERGLVNSRAGVCFVSPIVVFRHEFDPREHL